MGQKSQPISLRLQKTNRSFDSYWYSDFFYSERIKGEIESHLFLNSITKQIQYGSGRFFVEYLPKQAKITFFFFDPTRSRLVRSKFLGLPPSKKRGLLNMSGFQGAAQKNVHFGSNELISLPRGLAFYAALIQRSKPSSPVLFTDLLTAVKIQSKQNSFPSQVSLPQKGMYQSRIESVLSHHSGSMVSFHPIRSVSSFQSALFLAEDIMYYLERRVPFRKIKNRIFRELKYHTEIRGIRLACSGRVGRIQRAKIHYEKSGQTPLNRFSSKIDFASIHGSTPFGLVGLKVWICFA